MHVKKLIYFQIGQCVSSDDGQSFQNLTNIIILSMKGLVKETKEKENQIIWDIL